MLVQNAPPPPKTASDTVAGDVELATTTETLTGSDTARAVTPDALAALWEKGSSVASASTISLGEGGFFHITGTTGITDIDFATAKDGRTAWLIFDGALTITHNATTLKIAGGANWTTAAGDRALVVQDSGDNVVLFPFPVSGKAVVPPTASEAGALAAETSGTYTPAIEGDDSNPTVTYTIRTGRWVKHGTLCWFYCYIKINTYSGGSGAAYVTAPFTVKNVTDYFPSVTVGYVYGINWGTGKTNLGSFGYRNFPIFYMMGQVSNGDAAYVQCSQLASGDEILVSGWFEFQ